MKTSLPLICALFLFSTIIIGQTLTDSLILFYPFNNNSADESGNGYNPAVYGAILTTDRFGTSNAAYYFDGVDDYMNVMATFDYEYRSVSVWVKPLNINGSGVSSDQVFTQDASTLSYGRLMVRFENGNVRLNAGGEASTFDQATAADTWYHIVVVRDGVDSYYYVDGQQIGIGVTGSQASTFNPNENLIIGAGRSTTDQFFSGSIDDFRIYNRALDSTDVINLYNDETTAAFLSSKSPEIEIYPNPTVNVLFIKGRFEISKISIRSIDGREMQVPKNNYCDGVRVDLSNLTNGNYYAYIVDQNGIKTQGFIVLK